MYMIGDTAYVRTNLKIGEIYYMHDGSGACDTFEPEMSKLCGKLVTITGYDVSGKYTIKEDMDCYNWTDDMLEDVVDYRSAFRVACELLNGSILYGIDSDKIFEIIMKRDGCVSSNDYEKFIIDNLGYLMHGGNKCELLDTECD